MTWIANVRVQMPMSTAHYLEACAEYRQSTEKLLTEK